MLVCSPACVAGAPLHERGCVVHLQLISPLGSIGRIDSIEVGHDGANSVDAWFCQEILVRASTQVFVCCTPRLCPCAANRAAVHS